MARKIDNPLVRRKDLQDGLALLRTEGKGDIARLAIEMDRRFTLTASQASMDALTAKVDRFIAAMDRTSGEQADNRRSLMIYDAVLGEHRRSLDTHEKRISSLESRIPPP